MIKLRIDVDYPYPSRIRSFIYTILNTKIGKDYLKNSKILAKMINYSSEEVEAYWFFTTRTIPDKELMALMNNRKHAVALHVVNDPKKELNQLEGATRRKVDYYTIHGTSRVFARVLWRRKLREARATISDDFQLQSFHEYPTLPLDSLSYVYSTGEAVKAAERYIARGEVLEVHPEWLFRRGTINHRGPCYEALRRILKLDEEPETLAVRKKIFLKIANDNQEYARNITPTDASIERLRERGIDIFTFIERKWCNKIANPPHSWLKAGDNLALIKVTTFDEWWKSIGKKTRNMVRKAEKAGVRIEIAEPNEKLAMGILRIYNETPIRQERAFPHYGQSSESAMNIVANTQDTFIAAYLEGELAGFIQLVHGDRIAIISQILSLQRQSDKAINNALIAKAVEVCVLRKCGWLMYGRMGNHPSLDNFKRNNGFEKFPLTRYYVPITRKGRIATYIGLHREIKDVLPQRVKYPLIPIYNWISRNKLRFKPNVQS